jgi:hypothetical protein
MNSANIGNIGSFARAGQTEFNYSLSKRYIPEYWFSKVVDCATMIGQEGEIIA